MLRIVDLEGRQSADTLIFDATRSDVRYNAPNTVKLAKSVYVTKGVVLYDDLAQPMMTVIEDTVGRHDTLAGCCSREINKLRYGEPGKWSCRDNFLEALGPLGMNGRTFRPISTSPCMCRSAAMAASLSMTAAQSRAIMSIRAPKRTCLSSFPTARGNRIPVAAASRAPIRLMIWQTGHTPQ